MQRMVADAGPPLAREVPRQQPRPESTDRSALGIPARPNTDDSEPSYQKKATGEARGHRDKGQPWLAAY